MIFSFFISGKDFHISTENYSHIYSVNENRQMADKIMFFIEDVIYKTDKQQIKKIFFSLGPASFTVIRIINSIAKGFFISDSTIEFIGISSFLTYLSVISKNSKNGIIAIPTMRGDYFSCEYSDHILKTPSISCVENINALNKDVYYENNEVFKNLNLACYQIEVLNRKISVKNNDFISSAIDVDYGFTPEYKF